MSDPVQLSVRSQLQSIIDELEKIKAKADEVKEGFDGMGDAVGDGLEDNVKKTEKYLGNLRGLGRRVADQLRGDFKSLLSINALQSSLKLSDQFKGSVTETVKLSDAIRKLGSTFGIAKTDFSNFQAFLTKGLGEIGMSSDVATRALEGLSTTSVRGDDNILQYAKTSGQLASVGREQGKEGDIARSIANVIQARGANVNDPKQVAALAESIRRVFVQTGAAPSKTLDSMERIFSQMPKDLRESISSVGLGNLAAASAVGGPGATKFIEEYMSQSPIERMAFDAQGGRGIFGENGFDAKKLTDFAKNIQSRIGGDPRKSAETLGLSPEAAEGFVRLAENMEKVVQAQDKMAKATGDLDNQYKESMGFSEAFNASINRVKKTLATPLSYATQKGNDILSDASQSDLGAAGVVAGGGLLAALLAGGGLKGIGKGLLGTAGSAAKAKVAEEVTGQKTIPVYVTNASEIGSVLGNTVAGGFPKVGTDMSNLQKGGMVLAAGAIGAEIGSIIAPYVYDFFAKNTAGAMGKDNPEMDALDRLSYGVDKLFGGEASQAIDDSRREILGPGVRATTPDEPAKPVRPSNPSQPMPGSSAQQQSSAGSFPTQPIKVEVYTKERGLKVRSRTPGQGASN